VAKINPAASSFNPEPTATAAVAVGSGLNEEEDNGYFATGFFVFSSFVLS